METEQAMQSRTGYAVQRLESQQRSLEFLVLPQWLNLPSCALETAFFLCDMITTAGKDPRMLYFWLSAIL